MSTYYRLSTKAAAKLPRYFARRQMATVRHQLNRSMTLSRPLLPGQKRMAQLGGAGIFLGTAQYYLGSSDNFFEHKFTTSKKPEDLATFYGSEDFMELFCILPIVVDFMMRGAEFDDNGTIHAWGLLGPGELEVSIDFEEKEVDTNGDGNLDTIAWFNKKEHFHDVAPSVMGGFTLWEMTQNFGYHLKDDGTCEVYHHGEHFHGLFPLRLLFQLHSKYVIWATEKYVNSEAFGMEDRESDLEEQRQNVPLHVFKEFVDGLVLKLEKSKVEGNDPQKNEQLEVTLQRLKTISSGNNNSMALPRLRTLRSHKTNLARAHLIIEDEETKDTIRAAINQISASGGKRHDPVAELGKLARHATLVTKRDK